MTDQPDLARSFGAVAAAYDRGRPDYPAAAVEWLVGRDAATIVELGAGTGKLTRSLVAAGHDVHATDPDAAMLEVLRERLPDVRTTVAGAEEIPAGDHSVDLVIAAQAFHWFDHRRALPEIARVLKNGGHLALVWNERDARIPWVRRLGALIGSQEQLRDPVPVIEAGVDGRPLFEPVQRAHSKHWQDINRDSIVDLVLSRSNVASLPPEGREAKLAEVLAFYDEFGRGYDGMQLPYVTDCYRARVIDRFFDPGETSEESTENDGTDTDMLLIDFR